jgi:predicted lipoprotein with Yx(FWY)xxD motif
MAASVVLRDVRHPSTDLKEHPAMSRHSDLLIGWSLAATGAMLAIAAVASVILLSSDPPASAGATVPVARGHAGGSVTPVTISARRTQLGEILVGPDGHTVYGFSRDTRDHDMCASVNGCLSVWPIVAAHGPVHAGAGVNRALLGTITVHGQRQITYAGHPLYTYVGDDGPASTVYVGEFQFGGTWPALAPSGRPVR